eukprot:gene27131-33813_t
MSDHSQYSKNSHNSNKSSSSSSSSSSNSSSSSSGIEEVFRKKSTAQQRAVIDLTKPHTVVDLINAQSSNSSSSSSSSSGGSSSSSSGSSSSSSSDSESESSSDSEVLGTPPLHKPTKKSLTASREAMLTKQAIKASLSSSGSSSEESSTASDTTSSHGDKVNSSRTSSSSVSGGSRRRSNATLNMHSITNISSTNRPKTNLSKHSNNNSSKSSNSSDTDSISSISSDEADGVVVSVMAKRVTKGTSTVNLKRKSEEEKDGFCITADITSDSVDPTASSVSLTVEVTENKDSATGEAKHIKGTIVNNDFQSDPGEFAITVEGKKVSVWVIGTGELDANGQYPWISLSDSKSENLFILARDVSTFESEYKDAVLKQVKKQGFVWPSNKPVKTFQSETECVNTPLPIISPISETVPITYTTHLQGAASGSSADTTFKPPADTHQNMQPPPSPAVDAPVTPADAVATDSTAPKVPVGRATKPPIQPVMTL